MATGYTDGVRSGKVTDFHSFAMVCARGMGANIMMRDDPLDAPIQEYQPTDYHTKRVEEAREEVKRVKAMTPEECEREAEAEYAKVIAFREEVKQTQAQERARYEAMLASVEAWTPPSADHENFKTFMREQLTESIRFDCSSTFEPAYRQTGIQWRLDRVKKLLDDVHYHASEHEKEVERVNGRNTWNRLLRESLSAVAAHQPHVPA